jgi:hypothetical protein
MEHRLIANIQKALGWTGPELIGQDFSRGHLPDPELCSRLLTPQKLLDLMMRRSMAPHRLQCLVDGEFLHPRRYLAASTARTGEVPIADMQRLGALVKSGCTLVADQLNAYDPTLEVACRALQWWTRELVQVNAFLTTNQAAGFELHWDDHDVIIVQLAGEKSWEIRGPSRPVPMFRDGAPNLEPSDEMVWSGTLRAGEVMHIPRGYWHQATRQERGDGYSLHVTFGLTKRTGVHWLGWLADQARQQDIFRHDIERWGLAEDRAAQHLALIEAAVRLVTSSFVADYLERRERQQPPSRHVVTHGVFGRPSEVVCLTDFPPAMTLGDEDEVVTVAAPLGREIQFKAAALPALRQLLSGRPVAIDKVSADTGLDASVLAEVLLAEGICGELTAELANGYRGMLMPAEPRPALLPVR